MEKLITDSGAIYTYHVGDLYKNKRKLKHIDFGLEGTVYKDGKKAIKIYHEFPEKEVLSGRDIRHLSKLTTKRIILPDEVIRSDRTRGYTMPFIKGDASSIYTMDKVTLLEEIDLIIDDLKELGERNILVSDLRDTNYLSTKKKFYLIDSGDYMITEDDCVDANISAFYDFFVEDILGVYLFDELRADKAFGIYQEMKRQVSRNGVLNYVDDHFNGSISEEVKRLVK